MFGLPEKNTEREILVTNEKKCKGLAHNSHNIDNIDMRIIGIESSCDETGVAIYDSQHGLLAHTLHSQVALHAEYGGVVPELASRDHVRKTLPLLRQLMEQTGTRACDIDGVAYTAGPGLIGALLVGAAIGRSLAWTWGVPAIGVHHLEGHLLAPLMEDPDLKPPFIALLVSGGHTMLMQVDTIGSYKMLGTTLDDAAGEAFDKTAKILGLGYPGGPALAKFAEQGDPTRFHFPRPMTNRPGLDFSFSGLKTFTVNALHHEPQDDQTRADIARAFEEAVADTLAIKCRRAIEQTGIRQLIVAGGVSANKRLRERLDKLAREHSARVSFPRLEFCTDNGAMIAYAGLLRLQAGQREAVEFTAQPRWPLESLAPL